MTQERARDKHTKAQLTNQMIG